MPWGPRKGPAVPRRALVRRKNSGTSLALIAEMLTTRAFDETSQGRGRSCFRDFARPRPGSQSPSMFRRCRAEPTRAVTSSWAERLATLMKGRDTVRQSAPAAIDNDRTQESLFLGCQTRTQPSCNGVKVFFVFLDTTVRKSPPNTTRKKQKNQ